MMLCHLPCPHRPHPLKSCQWYLTLFWQPCEVWRLHSYSDRGERGSESAPECGEDVWGRNRWIRWCWGQRSRRWCSEGRVCGWWPLLGPGGSGKTKLSILLSHSLTHSLDHTLTHSLLADVHVYTRTHFLLTHYIYIYMYIQLYMLAIQWKSIPG